MELNTLFIKKSWKKVSFFVFRFDFLVGLLDKGMLFSVEVGHYENVICILVSRSSKMRMTSFA